MKFAIVLLVALVQSDIKFYFDDKNYEDKCDGNRKLTLPGDCCKCPPLMIADPLKKTCIDSPNYFGEALGWGDHCISRSGVAATEFGSHATEFGTGVLPEYTTVNTYFKFRCVVGS